MYDNIVIFSLFITRYISIKNVLTNSMNKSLKALKNNFCSKLQNIGMYEALIIKFPYLK